jgi:hypothetical protein
MAGRPTCASTAPACRTPPPAASRNDAAQSRGEEPYWRGCNAVEHAKRERREQSKGLSRQMIMHLTMAWVRLDRDWARMLTDDQFPEEHWRHLRTTNVVDSPFAAVRLRTRAAKRFESVEGARAVSQCVSWRPRRRWRRSACCFIHPHGRLHISDANVHYTSVHTTTTMGDNRPFSYATSDNRTVSIAYLEAAGMRSYVRVVVENHAAMRVVYSTDPDRISRPAIPWSPQQSTAAAIHR